MRSSLLRQVLFLVGLAFLPAIGQALYYRSDPAWQGAPVDSGQVTLTQAKNWGDTVLWIDARSGGGLCPGACARCDAAE